MMIYIKFHLPSFKSKNWLCFIHVFFLCFFFLAFIFMHFCFCLCGTKNKIGSNKRLRSFLMRQPILIKWKNTTYKLPLFIDHWTELNQHLHSWVRKFQLIVAFVLHAGAQGGSDILRETLFHLEPM